MHVCVCMYAIDEGATDVCVCEVALGLSHELVDWFFFGVYVCHTQRSAQCVSAHLSRMHVGNLIHFLYVYVWFV
jgi:hypothetical protein